MITLDTLNPWLKASAETEHLEFKEAGLIKSDTSDSESTRYARYLPYWA